MPKRRGNGNKQRKGLRNGNRSLGGPSHAPSRALTKKFQYIETVKLNNSTSQYSYYSKYVSPDITKATGSKVQFAAYELFRLKRIRVSIQASGSQNTASDIYPLNWVANTTVWTAADFGKNETISGTSIQQYQNAKRNTINLNKFTNIVDTTCRINTAAAGGVPSLVVPASFWINTTDYNTSFYSGYQIFIQSFGYENVAPESQPAFTIQTELEIEFMQPAFQNTPSTFATRAFDISMIVQPDGNDPSIRRTYKFDRFIVEENTSGVREFIIRLEREDGQPGSLTFTGSELREAVSLGTSGQYFNGRPALYNGPVPPTEIPSLNLTVASGVVN